MQQAMLPHHFKTAYPVIRRSRDVFSGTRHGASWRASIYIELYRDLRDVPQPQGLDLSALRHGSFFTREGKRRVPGSNPSYGTALSKNAIR